MTTRVDVLKTHHTDLRFPEVCPVCGTKEVDSQVKLNSFFGINKPFNEGWLKSWPVNIEVCRHHKSSLPWGRVFSGLLFAILMLLVILGFVGIWMSFPPMHGVLYALMGVVFVSMAIILHNTLYVAPVLYTAFSYRLIFTFRDDQYAEQFARLNGVDTVYDQWNQARSVHPS